MKKEETTIPGKEKSTEEKRIPNMGDPQPVKKPTKRRKKKKLLATPTSILRILMILLYVGIIFTLSLPAMTTTACLDEKLEVTTLLSEAKMKYATQEEIDSVAEKLQAALDGLKENPDYQEEETHTLAIPRADLAWTYHLAKGVKADQLVALIDKAKAVSSEPYTEESIKTLRQTTLEAQRCLCATVTITRSMVQLALSGNVNGSDESQIGGIVVNVTMVFFLALLPFVGFVISMLDRTRNIKNIFSLIGSVFAIAGIFLVIYPYVAIGSVIMFIEYVALGVMAVSALYAKQQEKYIVAHPELEAEFTEKHPHLVKALINYKSIMPAVPVAEKTYASAQNAKKHGRSRK